jgi:radical SAM superfamily enzyme YgiQ (UPF0313 family)
MSLKTPGAVLLISCYELGHQPYSIASPAALLHEAGYDSAALDLAVEHLRPEIVTAARVVAIAVPMHTALRIGSNVVARVRSMNPDCHICLYGLYASLNAAALLERGADSTIGGEFEEPLLRLVQDLDRGGTGPVHGVRSKEVDQPSWLRKIRFAVPRRHLLPPLHRYAHLLAEGETRTAGYIEASRGCLHLCRHCPIPAVYGGRFFIVPRDVVMADVRNQVASGARHITFGDPDFLNGPGHVMAIVRQMHDEFPELTFDFTAKIEHLLKHRALLPNLARSGCLFITSAVESLSDRVLSILDKGHTRADVLRALEILRAAGLVLRPSFVPFTPWTSLEDYRNLLEFVEEQNLADYIDAVQLSIRLLLPPGSLLLDRAELRPHLGSLDSDRFTYRWTHPDPTMDRLQAEIGAIVEEAARDREGSWQTFLRIKEAADRANGTPSAARPVALLHPPAPHDKGRPPRLSEPWYC